MKLSVLFVCLLSAVAAFAQGGAVTAVPTITNTRGEPVPYAQVSVCSSNPGSLPSTVCNGNFATIYTDVTIATPCQNNITPIKSISGTGCTNPGKSDGLGNVIAYAAAGQYWCEYSGGSITRPVVVPCFFANGGSANLNCPAALNGSIGAFTAPTSFSCDPNFFTDFQGNWVAQSGRTIGPVNGFIGLIGGGSSPGSNVKFKLGANEFRWLAPATLGTSYYIVPPPTTGTPGQVIGELSESNDGNGDPVVLTQWQDSGGCTPAGGDHAIQVNHPDGTCYGDQDFTYNPNIGAVCIGCAFGGETFQVNFNNNNSFFTSGPETSINSTGAGGSGEAGGIQEFIGDDEWPTDPVNGLCNITSTSVTANVITVQCSATSSVTTSSFVRFAGLTTQTFLNGVVVKTATSTSSQFTAPFTHANYSSTADTGTATHQGSSNPNPLFIQVDGDQPNASTTGIDVFETCPAFSDTGFNCKTQTGILFAFSNRTHVNMAYSVDVADPSGTANESVGLNVEPLTQAQTTHDWALRYGKFFDSNTSTYFQPVFGVQANGSIQMLNCSSSASPAACNVDPGFNTGVLFFGAQAGSVAVPAAATTLVVNDTNVTANSQIMLSRDNSLGTKLSVTCNTQSSLVLGTPYVSARTAGTSFTVKLDVAPTTNPLCLSFQIVN